MPIITTCAVYIIPLPSAIAHVGVKKASYGRSGPFWHVPVEFALGAKPEAEDAILRLQEHRDRDWHA